MGRVADCWQNPLPGPYCGPSLLPRSLIVEILAICFANRNNDFKQKARLRGRQHGAI